MATSESEYIARLESQLRQIALRAEKAERQYYLCLYALTHDDALAADAILSLIPQATQQHKKA